MNSINPDWQPIETAPLDTTDILVATPKGMYVACYLGPEISGHDEDSGWYVETSGGDCQPLYETPTHWMSLPTLTETSNE